MKNIIAIFLLFSVFGSCNSHHSSIKAHVFERKSLPGNKILVRYVYNNNGLITTDSSIINNTIIPQDSIGIDVLREK